MRASDEERKHLKSKAAKIERQSQKLSEDIAGLKREIEEAQKSSQLMDDELKANRERRIKSWAGNASFMRILYPLKARMDTVLDERSKIKAELEEAQRIQKKAESDLDSSEKYVEKCRNTLTAMEEEYVSAQTQIHALEKQDNDYRADKESLARQLKEEEEHLPFLQAEAASLSEKLEEQKKRLAEKTTQRKQHEKNIRDIESAENTTQTRLESNATQMKQTDEKIKTAAAKSAALTASMTEENTKLIQVMDQKQALDKQLADNKKHQTIIESEISIIAGIYAGKP
jgi:chromosome segregation ATPase